MLETNPCTTWEVFWTHSLLRAWVGSFQLPGGVRFSLVSLDGEDLEHLGLLTCLPCHWVKHLLHSAVTHKEHCSWFSCVKAKPNTTDYNATEDRIVQRHEDMHWNNTWLGTFSPILTDEMGQTTPQTAEILLIREYKTQPTIKRHVITVPSLVSLCSYGHYPHLCTAQSAIVHYTHAQALCHSLTHCPSVQGWQLSFIVSAPSSFHYCLRKCNQNRKRRQRKPELDMSDWDISAQEKVKKIKKIQLRSN